MRTNKHNNQNNKKKKQQKQQQQTQSKHNIYNELFHGLTNYQQSTTDTKKPSSKRKTIKVKRLRLKRSSSKQNNNNTITNKGGAPTEDTKQQPHLHLSQSSQLSSHQNTSDMMRNQNSNVNNDNTNNISQSHSQSGSNDNQNEQQQQQQKDSSLEILSAWEREEDRIDDEIHQTCNISYQKYEHYYQSFARLVDQYAMEYASRGETVRARQYSRSVDSVFNNARIASAIHGMLGKGRWSYRYSTTGDGFAEYKRLENLITSYNIPEKSSNGIITPNMKVREWFDVYGYSRQFYRDQQDWIMKNQPTSCLKYMSDAFHRKWIQKCKAQMLQKNLMHRQHQLQQKQQLQHPDKPAAGAVSGNRVNSFASQGPIPLIPSSQNPNANRISRPPQRYPSSNPNKPLNPSPAPTVRSNGNGNGSVSVSGQVPVPVPVPAPSNAIAMTRRDLAGAMYRSNGNGYPPRSQSRPSNPIPMNTTHTNGNGNGNSNGNNSRLLQRPMVPYSNTRRRISWQPQGHHPVQS